MAHFSNCISVLAQLSKYTLKWLYLTGRVAFDASRNRDAVGAASVDYLMLGGYVSVGYQWLRMMDVARSKLKADPHGADAAFYSSKIKTGEFYFAKLMPRAQAHCDAISAGPKTLSTFRDEEFLWKN